MKTIINGTLPEFKNAIKEFGREIDNIITYTINGTTTILGNDELYSVAPHYTGDLLKSVMKQLDVNSEVDIPLGTQINYKFGVKVRNDEVEDYTDNYDYINFGNYIVYSSEKLEDTNSYQLVCYDKMLYAMKDYDTPKLSGTTITYPITIKNYLIALCDTLGLTFKNENEDFVNDSYEFKEEIYLDSEDKSLNYLYRDVLDDIAELTASTICINANDELELRYVNGSNPQYYKYGFLDHITGSSAINLDGRLGRIDFSFDTIPTSEFNFFEGIDNHWGFPNPFKLTYLNGTFKLEKLNNGEIQYITHNYQLEQGVKYYITIRYGGGGTSIEIGIYNYSTSQGETMFNVGIFSWSYYDNFILFGNNNNINLYEARSTRGVIAYYQPCYDKDTLEVGIVDKNYMPMLVLNGYTGNIPTIIIDEIDKDFIKEDGAGFGDLFGPINTLTLVRTNDDYSKTLSIPYNLPEEDRKEIIMVDNTAKETSVKEALMRDILNSLYGLYYTKNNYKSTGLGYLDLLDRYNVVIDGTTYPCIMLNDDFQVEAGLEEDIFAGEMTNSKNTYIDSDKSVRINDRTSYRLDKLENKTKDMSTYSTNEVEVGTWIDGKPLYRKVVQIPTFSTTNTNVQTGITGADFVIMKGYFTRPGYANLIYSIDNTYMNEYRFYRDSGIIQLATNNVNVEFTGYIVFEYTKS